LVSPLQKSTLVHRRISFPPAPLNPESSLCSPAVLFHLECRSADCAKVSQPHAFTTPPSPRDTFFYGWTFVSVFVTFVPLIEFMCRPSDLRFLFLFDSVPMDGAFRVGSFTTNFLHVVLVKEWVIFRQRYFPPFFFGCARVTGRRSPFLKGWTFFAAVDSVQERFHLLLTFLTNEPFLLDLLRPP